MKFRHILAVTCVILLFTGAVSAADPTFHFSLSVDGKTEKTAAPGDVITVMFTVQRTDSAQPFSLLAMQNEICYDSADFALVEDSLLVRTGISTHEIDARGGLRELYMNSISLTGGTEWNAKTTVGSFQLRVTATGGTAVIRCTDFSVTGVGGSYSCTADTVTVHVSEECTVRLDTGETILVTRGEKIPQPETPTRTGYTFGGWCTDVDCQNLWDFDGAVTENLRLYARWNAPDAAIRQNPLPFDDVTEADWFYDSVRFVYESGMMNGDSATRFAPEDDATRAMLVTILWRLEGRPGADYLMLFEDVEAESWYTEAVRWAASEKIVTGYSETEFAPDGAVTREQLAAILWRYARYKGYDVTAATSLDGYSDAGEISDYAVPAMEWACAVGLLRGVSDTSLAPADTATRAMLAAILARFCGWIG